MQLVSNEYVLQSSLPCLLICPPSWIPQVIEEIGSQVYCRQLHNIDADVIIMGDITRSHLSQLISFGILFPWDPLDLNVAESSHEILAAEEVWKECVTCTIVVLYQLVNRHVGINEDFHSFSASIK